MRKASQLGFRCFKYVFNEKSNVARFFSYESGKSSKAFQIADLHAEAFDGAQIMALLSNINLTHVKKRENRMNTRFWKL